MDGSDPRAVQRWDTVQHLFTIDPGKPPPDHLLLVGELALGLADPVQLWAGVPTDIDPKGYKLLFDSSLLSGLYTLPPASTTVRGGIRVDGTTVTISDTDVLSATGGASVTIADTPPPSPKIGDLWWDSIGVQLYVWYEDPTSSQWVIANSGGSSSTGGGGGDFPEAPLDGKTYGRQMASWTQAIAANNDVVDGGNF